jgi:hypothetical protein
VLSTQRSSSKRRNMPSSASSSSSIYIIGDSSARHPADADDDSTSGGDALTRPIAECFASSFRTQESLDALCKKHRVPEEFTPLPAGDRRAFTRTRWRSGCASRYTRCSARCSPTSASRRASSRTTGGAPWPGSS